MSRTTPLTTQTLGLVMDTRARADRCAHERGGVVVLSHTEATRLLGLFALAATEYDVRRTVARAIEDGTVDLADLLLILPTLANWQQRKIRDVLALRLTVTADAADALEDGRQAKRPA